MISAAAGVVTFDLPLPFQPPGVALSDELLGRPDLMLGGF